jgi:NAD dependent epimerase/dehydratase family enzyme
MTLPVIGIIGMGFLGREIARQHPWPQPSWATTLEMPGITPPEAINLERFQLNWQDPAHWKRIPEQPVSIVLTVPPVHPEPERERERLQTWGAWMNQNRPHCNSLVYISTTGVYPNREGLWDESTPLEPDGSKADLRLVTESVLSEFFETRIIRSGAIYGEKRNIGERLIAGKPIPSGDHFVHRIHVADLARIVRRALTEENFPSLINAVDMDPSPSRAVADWILQQDFVSIQPGIQLNLKSGYATRTKQSPIKGRSISNRLLVETCNFRFLYPTFKEGLKEALG